MNIKQKIRGFKHKRITRFLTKSNPDKLESLASDRVVSSFKRAAKDIQVYKEILKKNSLQIKDIKTIDDFKNKIPVISKKDFFVPYEAEQWFVRAKFKKIKNFMTSSGFSGTFAYGADKNLPGKISQGVDYTLDYLFNTNYRKTFLINCIPMGVHINTSLALAEVSVRSDMALALAQKISPEFDQTIIVGDPHFIKKLVEEGIETGVNWRKINVSFICGQDWFPESFRTYISQLTEMDIYHDKNRQIIATMGMTELGLNIFHESFDTVRIRNILQQKPEMKKKLVVNEIHAAPFIFHYYPHRNYIEEFRKNGEDTMLLFSVLNKDAVIPLFRYDTGDSGILFSYNNLQDILIDNGYEDFVPELKLPLAAIYGRRNNYFFYDNKKIYPADIKLGLYEDFELAAKTTGYFKIGNKDVSPVIEIQLKPGIKCNAGLSSKFSNALLKYAGKDIPVKCYPYIEFPYGMGLSYEHKFVNL